MHPLMTWVGIGVPFAVGRVDVDALAESSNIARAMRETLAPP